MKILKKPVFLPVTCTHCGCVYKPGKKDMVCVSGIVLQYAPCPICRKYNDVKFEKEKSDA